MFEEQHNKIPVLVEPLLADFIQIKRNVDLRFGKS